MNSTRLATALALIFTTTIVYASCNQHLCQTTVKTLYVHSNSKVYVAMDSDMSQLDCTLDQGNFIVLKDTNPRHSEIYSMLLAARIAKESVVVRIVNGSSDCELAYTMLTD